VRPRAGLDTMEKRKLSCPYQESNPDSTVVQPVDCRYTGRAILAYKHKYTYMQTSQLVQYYTKVESSPLLLACICI
jgi:hypothetical protein